MTTGIDPFGQTVGEQLTLPDRYVVFDAIDQFRAGPERLGTVRGRDGDHDGEIPDRQRTDAMDRRDR